MVEEKQINKVFADLKIEVSPLPGNYTPESYGKMLMNESLRHSGVSYSGSTVINQSQSGDFTPEKI